MARRVILLLILSVLPSRAFPQGLAAKSESPDPITTVKNLYEKGQWEEILRMAPDSPDTPAELDYYRGLALARLQRWDEARKSFQAGLEKAPNDKRFSEELAGIAYQQKNFRAAKAELLHALRLDREDDYANNFLASIYFLEENLEAALKYWNRGGKPRLNDLSFDPQPRLDPALLNRIYQFSPGSKWERDDYLATRAWLENLDIFARTRFDLAAQTDGTFDLSVRTVEKGWGNSKWEGLISLLRGLPYLTIYPEFYNLRRSGLNWTSLVRWDDEKRRVASWVEAPLGEDPRWRYRFYFDARNENWDITRALFSPLLSAAGLNLETVTAGGEIRSTVNGRWTWSSGVEYSYRRFRNLQGVSPATSFFFRDGSAMKYRASLEHSLVRFPERRFTLDGDASGEFGTTFAHSLGGFSRIEGSLSPRWFPKAQGDDYEVQGRVRAGRTFGRVPFDELLGLSFERDNDLWLRGHVGTHDGKKGNSPLGTNFFLANWEMDKVIHQGSFLAVKLGPFLDTGKITDPSGVFGSRKWLWDTGVQCKLRVLGSFEFILGYGKDLRSGNNSFISTVSH